MKGHRLDVFIETVVHSGETADTPDVVSALKMQGYDEAQIADNVKILSRINKKKLSEILTFVGGNKKKTESLSTILYSFDDIYKISQYTNEQLDKSYKVSDLKSMYKTIYGSEPRKEMKKQELIDSIRYRFRVLNRAAHFNDNKLEE